MKGITRKGVYGFRKFYEYNEPMEVKILKKQMVQLEKQNKELKRENRNLKRETEESGDGIFIGLVKQK